MYVLENGQTKPCCNVPGNVPALGNVNEHGGEQVWTGKGFEIYRDAILNDQYPLKGCEACLKFKTGPKTHFAEQLLSEYVHWYSESYDFNPTKAGLSDPLQLPDGQEIYKRFKHHNPV